MAETLFRDARTLDDDASSDGPSSRVVESVFAVVILMIPFAARLTFSLGIVGDPDIWWHMAAGRWILEHRNIPAFDPFLAHGVARPWFNYSWFFDVGMWLAFRKIELAAPAIYGICGAGAVLVTCSALVGRQGSHLVRRAFVAAVGFMALCSHFGPRTYLFTAVFTGIILVFVRRCLNGGDARRGFWLLPMFALWANVHIEFMYALAFLGLATFQLWVQRSEPETPPHRAWKPLAIVTVACLAATLANPFGARLHMMMANMVGPYGASDFVSEMLANAFRSPLDYLLLVLFGGAVATLVLRRGIDFHSWGILVGSTYMSFHSQRASWLLCFVALDIIGGHPLLSAGNEGSSKTPPIFRLALPCATALVVVAFALAVLRAREGLTPQASYPYQAVAHARERHLNGPVFNDWNWGGFLRFYLPDIPGNIDGRGPLFDVDYCLTTLNVWRGKPGWKASVELDQAGFVIAPAKGQLTQLLEYDTRFERTHADDVAVVFVRRAHEEARQ